MSNGSNKSSRILPIVGFSVLAALFGVGVAWVAVYILAVIFKHHADQIVTGCMPILVVGGVLGFVAGVVVSARVARLDQKTEQTLERRYVGWSGRVTIYLGAPLFVVVAFSPFVDFLSRHFGDRIAIYSYFVFLLAAVAASMFLHDRIPERFIIPIGIVGWLLFVLWAIGFAVYMSRQPV